MNTKHRVSLNDFYKFGHDHEIAGSFGKGSHKSLVGRIRYDTHDVRFLVKEDNLVILETNSLEIAIEKYNELP